MRENESEGDDFAFVENIAAAERGMIVSKLSAMADRTRGSSALSWRQAANFVSALPKTTIESFS